MAPVTKIDLKDDKNNKFRLAAALLFLVIGAGLLAYAFTALLNGNSGWTEIKADSASELNCSEDFVFLYELGAGDTSATAENKAIRILYTDAVEKAYQLFNNDQSFDGVNNVYYINQHPNEVIEVDPVLYNAFSLVEQYGERRIYLGPVYEVYDNIFYCTEDSQTADYDPEQNDDISEFCEQVAEYAGTEECIGIELLGENKLKLVISPEYKQYLDAEGVTEYVDFFWMKNAFIVDYLADVMVDAGYIHGSISSHDGFVRNLDDREIGYSFNLFDGVDNTVYEAGSMNYTGAISLVSLRNYPLNAIDSKYYYEFQDGEIRTAYLDMTDARCKSSRNNLVTYSRTEGCAEVLLQTIPLYVTDEWNADAVAELAERDVHSIYSEDYTFYYNDSDITITNLYGKENVTYKAIFLR